MEVNDITKEQKDEPTPEPVLEPEQNLKLDQTQESIKSEPEQKPTPEPEPVPEPVPEPTPTPEPEPVLEPEQKPNTDPEPETEPKLIQKEIQDHLDNYEKNKTETNKLLQEQREQKNETKSKIENQKKNQKIKLLLTKHFRAVDKYGSLENCNNSLEMETDSFHSRDIEYLVDKQTFDTYQRICNLLSTRYYMKMELAKHQHNLQKEQHKELKMTIERHKLLKKIYIPGLPNHYSNGSIDTIKLTIKEVEKQIKLVNHKLKVFFKKLDGILLPLWTTKIIKNGFDLIGSYINMQHKKNKLNDLSCKIEVCHELLKK